MDPNFAPMPGPMPGGPVDPGFMPGPVVGPSMVDDPPWDLRWQVIFSPIGFQRYNMPLLVSCTGSAPPVNDLRVLTTYKLDTGGGWFMEADGELTYRLMPMLSAGLWARGSWYYVTGLGRLDSEVLFANLQPPNPVNPLAGSRTRLDSTLSRSSLATGLSAVLTF